MDWNWGFPKLPVYHLDRNLVKTWPVVSIPDNVCNCAMKDRCGHPHHLWVRDVLLPRNIQGMVPILIHTPT